MCQGFASPLFHWNWTHNWLNPLIQSVLIFGTLWTMRCESTHLVLWEVPKIMLHWLQKLKSWRSRWVMMQDRVPVFRISVSVQIKQAAKDEYRLHWWCSEHARLVCTKQMSHRAWTHFLSRKGVLLHRNIQPTDEQGCLSGPTATCRLPWEAGRSPSS